jgi:hypothetical protein
MNKLTYRMLELRLENFGWKQEFIGLWSNDLFDFYLDTNSDVALVRDLERLYSNTSQELCRLPKQFKHCSCLSF